MFNMARQSDVGYKLVIIYDAKQKDYHLTGYTGHGEFHIHYAQDGATLVFNSLEEVIKHIEEYK